MGTKLMLEFHFFVPFSLCLRFSLVMYDTMIHTVIDRTHFTWLILSCGLIIIYLIWLMIMV